MPNALADFIGGQGSIFAHNIQLVAQLENGVTVQQVQTSVPHKLATDRVEFQLGDMSAEEVNINLVFLI
jgi:hypothetical protein